MADMKIEEATRDENVTGSELLPASDGGAAKAISVSQIKDYALAQIAALAAASQVDMGENAVYLLKDGSMVPLAASTFANAILDFAFAKPGASVLDGNETFAIKNGSLLQSVTLARIRDWVVSQTSRTQIAALDAADALADANLAAVSQSGVDRKVTLALLRAYCLAGLFATASESSSPVAADDYFLVFSGGVLKKVSRSLSGLAVASAVSEAIASAVGAERTRAEAAEGANSLDISTLQGSVTTLQGTVSTLQTTVNGKQNTLTFDTTPTANSSNPVTSAGIKTALNAKQDTLQYEDAPTQLSQKIVRSGGIFEAIKNMSRLVPDVAVGSVPIYGYNAGAFVFAAVLVSEGVYKTALYINIGNHVSPNFKFIAYLQDTTPAYPAS